MVTTTDRIRGMYNGSKTKTKTKNERFANGFEKPEDLIIANR